MIALVAVFFLMLLLFGFIGASRGWGKEVLVIASVILALAVIALLEDLLHVTAFIQDPDTVFGLRIGIITLLTYFGYQSPKVARLAKATERRGQAGEKILGFVLGMASGFFVIGTYWYYAALSQYPGLSKYIVDTVPEAQNATLWVMSILPPVWLDDPVKVFVAVVVIFIIVIVYFV